VTAIVLIGEQVQAAQEFVFYSLTLTASELTLCHYLSERFAVINSETEGDILSLLINNILCDHFIDLHFAEQLGKLYGIADIANQFTHHTTACQSDGEHLLEELLSFQREFFTLFVASHELR
jgi:hypothetical protein